MSRIEDASDPTDRIRYRDAAVSPTRGPDDQVLDSVRFVLAAVIRGTTQTDVTAEKLRAIAEVLEGQAKVLRDVAGVEP